MVQKRYLISIAKTKLVTQDLAGFKAWLQANPVTVQYELATPVIKTVDLTVVDQDNQPTQLGTFENITHVSLESAGLIPEVEMEVATNLLEDTVFTLTDAFNTLYPTAAKPVVDGTLYGQTLVNLSSKKTKTGANNLNIMVNYLKSNTQYTVFFNYISDNPVTGRCSLGNKIGVNNSSFVGENGLKKVLVTTPELTSTDYRLFIYTNNNDVYTVNEVMVIEGNHRNIDIPYFEGMQSVQAPGITMTGNNLIDKDKMVDGFVRTDGTISLPDYGNKTTGYIKVKPNTTYSYSTYNIDKTLTGNMLMDLWFYYSDIGTISSVIQTRQQANSKTTISFTTPSDCKYLRIGSRGLNQEGTYVQLEESSSITPYEPYKSITLSTPSDLELRKVGEVQDEVNVMTGEVVERIGEIVLDGSEFWSGSSFESTNHYCAYTMLPNSINKQSTDIICDSLPVRDILSTSKDNAGCIINRNNNSNAKYGNIVIKIEKNKLISTDTNGLRKYLQSNPITVQYELKAPTNKTVDLSVVNQDGNETKLRTFDDTTHVLLNSEGVPMSKASLTVRTKIPSASSTSLLMDELSTKQEQLNTTVNEQSENVDATMIATTEIYEETL